MAAGDLILGQGDATRSDNFLGYAVGVSKDVPSGGTTTITSSDTASWLSAVQAGNERVICSSGLTFTPSEVVDVAAGTQLYCASGSFSVDGAALTSTFFDIDGDDCFFGNFIALPSIGVAGQGNNPGTTFEFYNHASSTGVYMFYVGNQTNDNAGSMSGDRPEAWGIWTASNETRLLTFHGCYIPTEESNSKMVTAGSGTQDTGGTNTSATWYRGYAWAATRMPSAADGQKWDVGNFVLPNLSGTQISGIGSSRSADVDVRGCYIYGNSPTFSSVGTASGDMYYVTSGAGNDNNLEVNSPTLDWDGSNPLSSSILGAYTGKPALATMDGTLATAILAEVAGTYAITQEAPPDTLDPITAGHAAWMSFEDAFAPTVNFAKMEVYEERWRRTQSYGFFYRWNNAARCLVKEWTADWPGLNPHAERGMVYLPSRTQFGGA